MTTTAPGVRQQGAHPDPLDPRQPPPQPARWPAAQRHTFFSPEMEAFRAGLRLDGTKGVRAAVLDDLSTYCGLPAETCLQRCIAWEQWSVQEWHARRRESAAEIADFYRTTESWLFDLLWYAYLQAEGYARPKSVAVARQAPRPGLGRRHLDFGSGVGVTAQLFQQLGYDVDLADLSTSLLAFARFRLDRRGQPATYIDLNVATLEANRYEVITAIDTLAHVPDLLATARLLHRALKPGGYLFANFDVRPKTPENAWHLYADDLPLRWTLQRVGFEPVGEPLSRIIRYRKVAPIGLKHDARGVRDTLLLRSPLRPFSRAVRYQVRRLARTASSPLVARWKR